MYISKKTQIKVTLNHKQAEELIKYKHIYGMSIHEIIKRAIDEYLKIEYFKKKWIAIPI